MANKTITFLVPSEEIKSEFDYKASLDKGTMSAVLNSWVASYLKGELFTKEDVLAFVSSFLLDSGAADKIAEFESYLTQKVDELPNLRSKYKVLSDKNVALSPGQLLKKIRKEKRMKLREVAEEVSKLLGRKYSFQNISRMEGQNYKLSREALEPVLKVYGYTYEEFMDRLNNQ